MRIILDASAAIEVVLDGPKAAEVARSLNEADEVIAPDLFVSEVTNTIWKYYQLKNLNITACDRALERGIGLVESLVPCKELYREAFLLARTAGGPAYDMFYLALARREDAAILTLDAALKKEAERQGIRIL